MNEDWISDAAGRIFSYAIEWNEGRKQWKDEDVANIIKHEMAENVRRVLRDAQSEAARPAPAGSEESEAR